MTNAAAAEAVAEIIVERARTGYHGDGHVFILNLEEHYAVRTRWRDVA